MKIMSKKRYKDCSKLEKIWRHRWFIILPFMAVYRYLFANRVYISREEDGKNVHTNEYERMSFNMWWQICRGNIDIKMKHYYTQEEAEKIIHSTFL